MPRVNIYIRNEDYAQWKAIEDKPALIHEALVNRPLLEIADTGMVGKVITKPEQVPKRLKEVKPDSDFSGFIPKSYSARKSK